jgi:hypothetical protein
MRAWRGLDLTEQDRARATTLIGEIVRTVPATDDPSLALGTAGTALLHAHLGDDERAATCAEDALVAAVAAAEVGAGLYEGITGPAWVLAHLDGWVLDLGDDDPLDAIDTALADLLDADWDGDVDLVSGLAGIGVYALERPHAAALVDRVVDHLARTGPPWTTRRPDDLGVAHGTPGIIGFLAATDATALRDDAAAWLLERELRCRDGFSTQAGGDRRARTAWCYGDPGVAVMLVRAGHLDDGHRLARLAAERALEESGVTDAAVCHGAGGVAHVFARLWQHTDDIAMHDAAVTWLRRALDLAPALEDHSFLEGRAGLALVLHAALGHDPTWDRVLLLS